MNSTVAPAGMLVITAHLVEETEITYLAQQGLTEKIDRSFHHFVRLLLAGVFFLLGLDNGKKGMLPHLLSVSYNTAR